MTDTAKVRSEILDTGHPRVKAARIVIDAPASTIFEILANPRRHSEIDGTKSVKAVLHGPERLSMGAVFGMAMHLGVNYGMTNTVVEFDEGRLIGWRHLGRWIWRYELEPLPDGRTQVTETFDARPTHLHVWLRLRRAYGFAQMAVAKTLVRLKAAAEQDAAR